MFATLPQLASYIQSELDTATAQLAVDGATARIRSATRQTISAVTADTVTLPGFAPVVYLPQRPVTAVTAVTYGGYATPGAAALLGLDYSLSGGDIVWRSGGGQWAEYVTVTYDHGYSTIPDDIVECCLALAAETYTNPGGLVSETVDDYTYRIGDTTTRGRLLLAEITRRYGRTAWTVPLR